MTENINLEIKYTVVMCKNAIKQQKSIFCCDHHNLVKIQILSRGNEKVGNRWPRRKRYLTDTEILCYERSRWWMNSRRRCFKFWWIWYLRQWSRYFGDCIRIRREIASSESTEESEDDDLSVRTGPSGPQYHQTFKAELQLETSSEAK